MKKLKLAIFALVALFASVQLNASMTNSASATCFMEPGHRHFLGLRAWYDGLDYVKYVEKDENGNKQEKCYIAELKTDTPGYEELMKQRVWTILFNVMALVLGIAGYYTVGLVIYGGFMYMMSRGEPVNIVKAKRTIANALIGLAICMGASTLTGAIADVIATAGGALTDEGVIVAFLNKAFFWAGVICTILIVYNGMQYITAAGDSGKVAKAKNGLTASIIGLVIVLSAVAIVNIVVGAMS